MMFKFKKNYLSLAIAGSLSLSGSCVFAQESSGESEGIEIESVNVAEDEAEIENVVVTGSRIKRDEFSSTAPLTVITSEKSALAGLLSASDILQNGSFASGQQVDDSFSGFVTDGGPGAESISLRGLGGAALTGTGKWQALGSIWSSWGNQRC